MRLTASATLISDLKNGQRLDPAATADVGGNTAIAAQKPEKPFRPHQASEVGLVAVENDPAGFRVHCGDLLRPEIKGDLLLDNVVPLPQCRLHGLVGIAVDLSHANAFSGIAPFRFEHQVVPVSPGPGNQVVDHLTGRALRPPGIELACPGCSPDHFRMESMPLGPGEDFEHALDIDGFRSPGVDDPLLPHRLEERAEIVQAMQFQKDVGVEVHKNDRDRLPSPGDSAVL